MDKHNSTILTKIKEITEYVISLGKVEVKLEETPTPEVAPVAEVEVKPELEVEVKEPEVVVEYATKQELADALEQMKSLFTKQYEKFAAEKEDLDKKNVELKAELDKKPDAPVIKHAPENVVVLEATNAKERVIQALRNANK